MTRFARSDGVRIAYEEEGRGEPLVLLPGFTQSRRVWREAGFVDAFLRAGRRVILVDPRGHGESDKPHDPAAYEPQRRAADVIAVLDALSIPRADLLGYSMGGAIAIAVAIDFPERCGAVILGGAHRCAQDMGFYREAVADGLDRWVGVIEAHVGPLPEEARAMLLANDVEALRAVVADGRPDRSRELAASGVPVLLYAGSEDPAHERARDFAAESGCRCLTLPGPNHMQAFFAVEQVVLAALEVMARRPAMSR